MILRFREEFALPAAEVYAYFRTPADWTRLYGLAGTVRDHGDGWFDIPLAGFPFPLSARNTHEEPNRRVRWEFRGFWRGEGEIRLAETPAGTLVEGYESIAVRWLFFLSPLVEKAFLERRFRAIWSLGWSRLRRRENRGPSGADSTRTVAR